MQSRTWGARTGRSFEPPANPPAINTGTPTQRPAASRALGGVVERRATAPPHRRRGTCRRGKARDLEAIGTDQRARAREAAFGALVAPGRDPADCPWRAQLSIACSRRPLPHRSHNIEGSNGDRAGSWCDPRRSTPRPAHTAPRLRLRGRGEWVERGWLGGLARRGRGPAGSPERGPGAAGGRAGVAAGAAAGAAAGCAARQRATR